MSEKKKLDELRTFIQLCFTMLEGKSLKEVSKATGLSLSTIYRLWYGQFSLDIRYRTVQAMGHAAGLELTWKGRKAKVRLIA